MTSLSTSFVPDVLQMVYIFYSAGTRWGGYCWLLPPFYWWESRDSKLRQLLLWGRTEPRLKSGSMVSWFGFFQKQISRGGFGWESFIWEEYSLSVGGISSLMHPTWYALRKRNSPGYVSFNMSRTLSRPVEGAGGMSREEECLLPFLCGRGLHSVCEDIQWSSPQLWAQTWSFCNFAALAWR